MTPADAPIPGIPDASPERDFGAALLDTAQTLICVLDREGRIVRFNRACEEATGFSADEVVGRHVVGLVVPVEDAEPFAALLEEWWTVRAPSPRQGHWLTKHGGRRLIAWANRPLLDDDGEVRYVLTSGLDITERESAASELWSLQGQLRDRLEELAQLAAEQAALRRVATLVASEPAPDAVFTAVTEEAGRLLGAESSALLSLQRRLPDGHDRRALDGGRHGRLHGRHPAPRRGRGHADHGHRPRRRRRAHQRLHRRLR